MAICSKYDIKIGPPHTPARLLDSLASHFIEPLCVNPTFVYDHPLVLSPLAKLHRNDVSIDNRPEELRH